MKLLYPPLIGYKTPCTFSDRWSNLFYNGFPLPNVLNDFTLQPFKNTFTIGTNSVDPKIYGFDYYGIKQDEKYLIQILERLGLLSNKHIQQIDYYQK
jgi:hypothetical protein